jgi:hypothetical protein
MPEPVKQMLAQIEAEDRAAGRAPPAPRAKAG